MPFLTSPLAYKAIWVLCVDLIAGLASLHGINFFNKMGF